MFNVLVVVLEQRKELPELLEAWQDVGVPGITIMPCAGAVRARSWLGMLGIHGIDRMFESGAHTQRLLFTAIDDDDVLERAVAAAERVVGGFDRPHGGLLLVVPLARALGMLKPPTPPAPEAEEGLAPAVAPDWLITRDTSVETVVHILDLEPTIVHPESPLTDVAQAMLNHPAVHVACVVDDGGHLVGLIDLRSLADHLFFHIFPEEFLGEITGLERALQYADVGRSRTAADAMQEPAWIRTDETVKVAFGRMHDNRVPGLPVIDDGHHVVGYINLLELLAVCARADSDAPIGAEAP